ncbi:TIGR02302 family protein [Aureimonas fodinaquatilis]|uniref:TIGR02302 family protein n=1 Tax=Aureimonas fodinaquatilis TaxID=2565783 RepID=A0A5B0DP18_9HYPH|nr:TIGR02302 family protein [Aureimonas fodinaquatilis]KAA0968587.1 TIGR02302 family protein [Aureimonas fodinaquatilis]
MQGKPARPETPANGVRTGMVRLAAGLWIFLERVWPLVLALGGLIGLFLILSWAGIFAMLPGLARIGIVVALVLAVLVALWRNRSVRMPTQRDIETRIEAETRLAHQPLQTQSDVALGDDPVSLALWQLHQKRMAERLSHLAAGLPIMRTERLDPHGLRAVVALLLVVSFAYSYGPAGGRVADAFMPLEQSLLAQVRVDAWVQPPAYTGRAPVFLGETQSGQRLEVPTGSVLSVRVSDGSGVGLSFQEVDSEEVSQAPVKAGETSGLPLEFELPVTRSGRALLATRFRTLGEWDFAVIADTPPSVRVEGQPKVARNGALEAAFVVEDDYGVARGKANFLPLAEPAPNARPLVQPPELNLAVPHRTKGEARGRLSTNQTENPYAGTQMNLVLKVEDDAGQSATSQPFALVLPERSFTNPLARAVVEQRRILALDANMAGRVVEMLDALTIHGDSFINRATDYLALRAVRERIANAPDDAVLLSAVDFLWDIALGIESGNLSFAERRLQEAQEALSQALQDGASEEEIAQLMQELRDAMQEFMQAMAEAMQNQPPQSQQQLGEGREIRQQDLQQMLDRIEDLARTGSNEAAQQLLSELQEMMNNLQMAQPGGQQNEGSPQPLDDLSKLLQQQQQLMDQTYDLGRETARQQMQGMWGEEQQPESGQNSQENQQGQQQQRFDDLRSGQADLQQQLEALKQALEELGLGEIGDLDRAGEAMGEAEGALGQGNDGEAVNRQSEALQAMRQAGREMMRQMQEAMQGQQGQGMGQGMGSAGQNGRDPLGRDRGGIGRESGQNTDIPEEIDVQRARRVLEQIRQRLQDRLLPQLERSYLERLLQMQ